MPSAGMESLKEVTLRPWPVQKKEELSLEDLHVKVEQLTTERGHLRDITEASLQEAIAAGKDVPDGVSGSAGPKQPSKEAPTQQEMREQIMKAGSEMHSHVEWAKFAATNALDLISLVLSNQKRGQNPASFSPSFREQGLNQGIPYGSFAMSKENHDYLQRSDAEKARIKDFERRQEVVAKGARMEALDAAADDILKAAKQFEKEVRRETKYWQEIVSVSEKGWPIQRLRQNARHVPFAVRYGAPEAGDHFKARGFAPLRMDKDGSILLDPTLTMKPKILRVRMSVEGRITGTSQLPLGTDAKDKSLEKSIKLARDSLFEEEIYHEMSLETRKLSAYGVEFRNAVIKVQAPRLGDVRQRHLLIDCVPRDESIPANQDHSEDWLAKLIAEGLRLLLTHEHSMRLYRRSQLPPPLSGQKSEPQTPPLLRTLLAILHHIEGVDGLYSYLHVLTQSLSSAGLVASLSTTRQSSWAELSQSFSVPRTGISSAGRLLEAFTKPFEGKATMTIPPLAGAQPETLTILTTTIIGQPLFGTEHRLSLPPSLISELGLLTELKFSTVGELTTYLDWIFSLHIAQKVIRAAFTSQKPSRNHDSSVKVTIKKGKNGSAVLKYLSVNVCEGRLQVKADGRADQAEEIRSCTWDESNGQPSLTEWIQGLAE